MYNFLMHTNSSILVFEEEQQLSPTSISDDNQIFAPTLDSQKDNDLFKHPLIINID